MKVKLYGVRGSLPTTMSNEDYHNSVHRVLNRAIDANLTDKNDISDFLKKLPRDLRHMSLGNTTCVTVTSESGRIYILDCGSGMRRLGDELIQQEEYRGNGKINIFITHTHWDHVQGLLFFKPFYVPGNKITFNSPYEDLKNRLEKQMDPDFFPVQFDMIGSTKNFELLKEGVPIQPEDNLTVDCYPLRHPGGSYAYRFREGDKTFVFATDAEFTGEDFEKTGKEEDFFLDADLLIIDSQYTLDESFMKFTWGHTCYTAAVNCGIRWNVNNLVLTHHEPSYSERKLQEIHNEAIEHRNAMKLKKPNIFLAREGLTFKI